MIKDPQVDRIAEDIFANQVIQLSIVDGEMACCEAVASWHLSKIQPLVEAIKAVEKYLVERGIEVRGTVGRTIILPQLRKALKDLEE